MWRKEWQVGIYTSIWLFGTLQVRCYVTWLGREQRKDTNPLTTGNRWGGLRQHAERRYQLGMMRFLEISSNRKPAPTQGPKDWRRLPLARPWWGLEPQRKGFKTELGATELGTLARKARRSGMELQDGGDHPNLSQILPSNFLPLCYSLNVYVPIKWVWGDLHHIWWRQFTLMSLCFSCSNFQIMSPPSDLVPEALQEAEMMNIYHTQKN